MLVRQLSEGPLETKTTGIALSILDEAADEPDCLDALIQSKPALEKFGEVGYNLYLRFLSRPTGIF